MKYLHKFLAFLKSIKYSTLAIMGALLFIWFIVDRRSTESKIEKLRKEIIYKDVLVKEKDGQYKKIVNYYTTKKELAESLKKHNSTLAKELKDKNERILILTHSVITFKEKKNIVTGVIIEKGDSTVKFEAFYPDKEKFFVKHSGLVSLKNSNLTSDWSFGKMPIDLVISEDKNGIWNYRISGSDFLVVDKLTVNSLPRKEFVAPENKIKLFSFLVGGGLQQNLITKQYSLKAGAGVQIRNKSMVMVDVNTKNMIGISYFHKLK